MTKQLLVTVWPSTMTNTHIGHFKCCILFTVVCLLVVFHFVNSLQLMSLNIPLLSFLKVLDDKNVKQFNRENNQPDVVYKRDNYDGQQQTTNT